MQVLFQLMWYNPPYPNEQLISLHLSHPMYSLRMELLIDFGQKTISYSYRPAIGQLFEADSRLLYCHFLMLKQYRALLLKLFPATTDTAFSYIFSYLPVFSAWQQR